MKIIKFKKIISFIALISIFLPSLAFAEFNPNYIISDQELTDHNSMSLAQVQKFLEDKGSSLANYATIDTDGLGRTASEIIWRVAQSYEISPKVLLVTLQKEQSLITTATPTQKQLDWAAGYGICDSCSMSDPSLQKYKGFATQVDYAAGWKRWFLDNAFSLSWVKLPGITYLIDTYKITPNNLATAGFYTYTPHYHGNYNFWKLWQDWFGKFFPDGTVLKEADGSGIWLLQRGLKRQFSSYSAFISRYSPDKLITVSKSELENYETGTPIKFSDYSLLRSPTGTVYLLVGDTRRGFSSNEVFRTIGFNPEEVMDATWEDLNAYIENDPITMQSVYPTGALLQDKTSGGVYYVENGIKKPIWAKQFLTLYFANKKITVVSPDELKKYSTGEPVKFKDGELVVGESSPTVYFISNGERRPIPSEQVFTGMGWKWSNIVKTTDKILSLHTTGATIYLGGAVESATK
ncbi:hypothetical protein KKD80_03125 [Patescibacteria group bacterium]|nr:hypothetical protein [Patescibacteria group bacterium]